MTINWMRFPARLRTKIGQLTFVSVTLFFCLNAATLSAGESPADSTVALGDTSDAYIVADSTFVEIRADGHATFTNRRITRVNSSEGARSSYLSLLENNFMHIKSVSGRQFNSSGIAIDSMKQKKELVKVCGFGPEFALYYDHCVFGGYFPIQHTPFTVEWHSTIDFETIGVWTGWLPEDKLATKSGFCEVRIDPACKFRIAVSGTLGEIKCDTIAPNVYQFSVRNLPALETEVSEPNPYLRRARVYVIPESFKFAGSEFDGSSWNSLSRGCFDMMRSAFKTSDAQEGLVNNIRKAQPGNLLDSLHRALANRFRYVAIYFNMGGWIPHETRETFKLAYGDCKDLASVYSLLFEKAGVTSHMALISTRNEEFINPELPTIGLFNHTIMYYVNGSDTTWVDPTCFDCALGDLPYSDEGLSALAIDPVNGDLLKTPLSDCSQNMLSRNVVITLNGDLGAELKLSSLLSGNWSHGIHSQITGGDAAAMSHRLMRYISIGGSPLVDQGAIKIAERDLSRLRIDFGFSQPRLLKPAGDAAILDLNNFRLFTEIEMLELAKRKHALELGSPGTVIDTVRIVLSEGMNWRSLPPADSLNSRFGDLSLKAFAVADTATIIRSLSRKMNIIEPADFAEYQSYRKEILAHLRPGVTISKQAK